MRITGLDGSTHLRLRRARTIETADASTKMKKMKSTRPQVSRAHGPPGD
jgi:hypothetical protein